MLGEVANLLGLHENLIAKNIQVCDKRVSTEEASLFPLGYHGLFDALSGTSPPS
jgi:hypothetical protein